ncbi:hypothetical protein TYRP_013369 [Tyrophagus putrescentiae]|nr:hypothetical protein TYRP_013369 [Tyrophagus putrescentiae]
MALAEWREELQRPKNGRSSSSGRLNGQYSPYNEHAKFPSLFRSSAAVAAAARSHQTGTADKDGGASEEAVLKSSTGENAAAAAAAADNSLKQWSSFAEGADFNVNLDIGLVDVEPEANLFLDETPLLARTGGGASSSASQQKQDTSSRSNGGGNALDGGSSVRETRLAILAAG